MENFWRTARHYRKLICTTTAAENKRQKDIIKMTTQYFVAIIKLFKCNFRTEITITLAKLVMVGIFLVAGSCTTKQEEYGCVNCPSVALRIQLQDAQDSSMISNAKKTQGHC
jgi:hypothetical protein